MNNFKYIYMNLAPTRWNHILPSMPPAWLIVKNHSSVEKFTETVKVIFGWSSSFSSMIHHWPDAHDKLGQVLFSLRTHKQVNWKATNRSSLGSLAGLVCSAHPRRAVTRKWWTPVGPALFWAGDWCCREDGPERVRDTGAQTKTHSKAPGTC